MSRGEGVRMKHSILAAIADVRTPPCVRAINLDW